MTPFSHLAGAVASGGAVYGEFNPATRRRKVQGINNQEQKQGSDERTVDASFSIGDP
jgi:hypothetical protein